jgi:hypothetical protein
VATREMPEIAPVMRPKASRGWGRRLGLVLFGLIVSGLTLIWSLQIIRQVWFPEVGPLDQDCRTGTRGLISALERARKAAAAETGDERAALARFRAQLDPEWQKRAALERACRDDPAQASALQDVIQLRYAEEHAVRYETVDLARLRRRVYALEPALHRRD